MEVTAKDGVKHTERSAERGGGSTANYKLHMCIMITSTRAEMQSETSEDAKLTSPPGDQPNPFLSQFGRESRMYNGDMSA